MSRRDTAELVLLSAIWGSSYLFIAVGAESLPPLTLVTIRLLIGAMALHVMLRMRGTQLPRSPRILAALAFMGVTNNIIPFTLITWAEMPGPQQVNSGLAGVLVAAVPIFTTLIAHFALRDERLNAVKIGGVLAGFAGVAVLMSPRLTGVSIGASLTGALAVLVASLSYAVALIFSRRVLSSVAPIVLGASQMTWSVALLVPLVLLVEHPTLAQVPIEAWFAVGWLGLLGSGVAYVLYFGLVQSIGATQTSLVTYLSPIVAVVLGAVFNGEMIHVSLVVGAVLTIGGAALVNRKQKTIRPPGEALPTPALDA